MSKAAFAPVLEFLAKHAPFAQMAPAHLEYMAKRLKLGFYAKGEIITKASEGPASRFFIIKHGRVRGEARSAAGEENAWELVTGECFPIGALLARRPVHTVHRAAEDTFCFELDRDAFDKLLVQSPVFHDFCTRRLASLLDQALRNVQAHSATRVADDTSLSASLGRLVQREPVCCPPDTPIREALARMDAERVGSIVIVDAQQRPRGVFTLHDVLSRVTLPQRDVNDPIQAVMTPEPLALPPTAFAYEAALLMAQHGFGHVCVVDKQRLIGVLSERDLFSLQRVGLVDLSRAIGSADDVPALARLSRDIHRLADQMLAQGASVDQLTQIITTLNDQLTRRVITLCLADTGIPTVPFTWLSFGSEGRHEQTLKTDQDNGILFSPPEGRSGDSVREELLPLARKINEALAACGFPLCQGNIMASNPALCLSLEEWKQRFGHWIEHGAPKHLLNATIFFDLRPLYGPREPAEALQAWILDRAQKTPRFLHLMAANALANRPPLGLVRDFQVASSGEHANTLDLKMQGLTPFVDGARVLALARGVSETNTVRRLWAIAEAQTLPESEAAAWAEAYHFIQLLRMRHHQQQAHSGQDMDNRINPDELNELDRRILKEAFRQARKLQARLSLDYQL